MEYSEGGTNPFITRPENGHILMLGIEAIRFCRVEFYATRILHARAVLLHTCLQTPARVIS